MSNCYDNVLTYQPWNSLIVGGNLLGGADQLLLWLVSGPDRLRRGAGLWVGIRYVSYFFPRWLVMLSAHQCFAVLIVTGAENILANLEEMHGWGFNKCGYWYWIIVWKFITPLLLAVRVVFS